MTGNETKKNPDFFLLAIVATLLLLGVLILSSASAILSQSKFHNSYYLLTHQITRGILPGIIFGFIVYKLKLETIRKYAPALLLLIIILLALVFVPGIGLKAGGAARWVNIGPINFQPSELLKLSFILYLASWLAARTQGGSKKNPKKGFSETYLAFLTVVGSVGLFLIIQPDISTFGIVALTAFAMYFMSGTPFKHTLYTLLLGVICLSALIWLEPYRIDRFMAWMFPEMDPMGNSFQPNQALITAGSGGIFGQGFGASSQKAAHIPELIGDSVFAPYALEMGFAGCAVLVLLFAMLTWRCFKAAKRSDDTFSRLAVLGIATWITVQALINMSSTIRLIPLSGVPLPFISYGGTAIMSELAAIGVILNVSRRS